jgi:tRNA/tmRNA/rRNA uracil-C5-methylase (TrmA/RlmC/RlmD family)
MPMRFVEGAERMRHTVLGPDGTAIDFDVAATGFWQVHPDAAQTFVNAVVRGLAPRPGDVVLDLYCGAGLFTAVIAHAVGRTGRVVGIESDAGSLADATANLLDRPWAEARLGHVDQALLGSLDLAPDLIVLDPPRSGAGASTMAAILGLGARAIAYVACDPASLARDVRIALDGGWKMRSVSAYDAFPMTHHVECIAILTPN